MSSHRTPGTQVRKPRVTSNAASNSSAILTAEHQPPETPPMLILLINKIPVVIAGEVMLHYGASRLLRRHGLGRALDRTFGFLLRQPRRR